MGPPVRRWSSANPLHVHCYSARLGFAYYRPSSRAQRRDGTVHNPCTVHGDTTRRLQIRQAYRGVSLPAPRVSGRPLFFDLGAPGPTTALNAGRWAGDPRRASSRRHAAGPVPLPLRGGTWRHRTPSRGKGSPGPPSPVEGAWPVMFRSSHVAASDPLGSPGPRGQPESLPALLDAQGPRTSQSSGRVRRP
jgi:hypothetical protein